MKMEKIIPVEAIPGIGREGIKEKYKTNISSKKNI
jgi:hypothetical protein